MNIYRALKYLLFGVIALSASHDVVHARVAPHGMYFGNFSGSCGSGSFGLMLTGDGDAFFLAHNASNGAVEYRDTLSLDQENVLRVVGIFRRQATVHLSFSRDRAMGTIEGECTGDLSAQRASSQGLMKIIGGLWTGTANGDTLERHTQIPPCTPNIFFPCGGPMTFIRKVGEYDGPMYALVAATGQAYVIFESNNPQAPNAGGPIHLVRQSFRFPIDCAQAADQRCNLEGPSPGTFIRGEFFPASSSLGLFARGTLFLSAPLVTFLSSTQVNGPFSLTRQIALPRPPKVSMPWLNLLLE